MTPPRAPATESVCRARRRVHVRREHSASLAIAAVVAGADLASKYWVRARAGDRFPGSGMQIQVVANRGASWGLGASAPVFIVAVEAVGVALVIWALLTRKTLGERACLAVVLGGAAANLVDRMMHGAVTDWIHLAPYPPYFNMADVAIRGGLIAVAALIAARRRSASRRRMLHSVSADPVRRGIRR